MENIGERQHAAIKTRAYAEGKITYQAIMDEFAGYDRADELIDELIDLIEHEPKRGGFIGASEQQWNLYQEQIQNIIKKLENSPKE